MSTDKPVINPKLIITDLKAASSEEATLALANLMHEQGYTTADYAEAVLAREKVYATGLPTNPPVAIPHADAGLAIAPGIAVGMLQNPVTFMVMGTEDVPTQVAFVFLLAVKDPKAQVVWLKGLIEFVQQADNLTRLAALRGASPEEVAELLEESIALPT